MPFNNRAQAINFYVKRQREIDEDLQAWLTHYETIKTEKINKAMKILKEYNDLIDWNRSELKKELATQKLDDSPGTSNNGIPHSTNDRLVSDYTQDNNLDTEEDKEEWYIMARGDFAKAFSKHRLEGGQLSRREFADVWNIQHGRTDNKPTVVQDEIKDDESAGII